MAEPVHSADFERLVLVALKQLYAAIEMERDARTSDEWTDGNLYWAQQAIDAVEAHIDGDESG